jgi:NADPH2:quinone reductase
MTSISVSYWRRIWTVAALQSVQPLTIGVVDSNGTTMRAIVLPRFGGPDVLELRDVPRPEARAGELLVRVVAAGTNPVDAKLRANGSWANLTPPIVIGYDAAGIVEEVGPCVTDFKPGDEVYYTPEIFGNPDGSYAEFERVPAAIVARKPRTLSFTEAAAIPLAGGTAWEAVIRRLAIRPGETVLIHGAAGGVGSFAVQFAKAVGARVLGTASAHNHDLLQQIGADVTIDYHNTDATRVALDDTGGRGVDAAFDIEGENRVARCLPAMCPFGRIACILPPQGDLSLLYPKNITLHGVFLTRERRRLEELAVLFERGQARVILDQVLPLEQVKKAHGRLDSGHGRGKVVLTIG